MREAYCAGWSGHRQLAQAKVAWPSKKLKRDWEELSGPDRAAALAQIKKSGLSNRKIAGRLGRIKSCGSGFWATTGLRSPRLGGQLAEKFAEVCVAVANPVAVMVTFPVAVAVPEGV